MPPPVSPSAARLTGRARDAFAAWFGAVEPEGGSLGGAGFSGCWIGRVRPLGGGQWFVLKSFVPDASRERAAWVHGFVRHLAGCGVAEVPVARETSRGETVVTDAGGIHWELVPFVEGVVTDAPSVPQAAAALMALARVHVAAATLPGHSPVRGPSPGMLRRRAQAAELIARPWGSRVMRTVTDASAAVLARRDLACDVVESPAGRSALRILAAWPVEHVPLQVVLRDIWSDHVIYAADFGERVAGIVDVHASGVDTPAADIARLAGSWRSVHGSRTADPALAWARALTAYESVRPLEPTERRLVASLHAAGVLCGLDNWFRWTLEEGRTFPNPAAVLSRIDRLLADMPAAVERLSGS